MGHILYKVGEDEYVIYSSVVEDLILWNATQEEICEFYRRDAIRQADQRTATMFERLEEDGASSTQFYGPIGTPAKAWREIVGSYNLNHRPKLTVAQFKKRLKEIGKKIEADE